MYIHELARLSGISTRALRYYEEIGLLVPERSTETRYRIYEQQHIDRLQQILFFRELGMPLDQIKNMLNAEGFEQLKSLRQHQEALLQKKQYIMGLLETVALSIQSIEEGLTMSNEQKFEAFKKQMIDNNEQQFGKEIREKYGEDNILNTYGKIRNMTKEQYEAVQTLEGTLLECLKEALKEGNSSAALAEEVAELHKRWLCFYWSAYTKEAHAGLAHMYLADQRFIEYYDSRAGLGATQFLAASIAHYTQMY